MKMIDAENLYKIIAKADTQTDAIKILADHYDIFYYKGYRQALDDETDNAFKKITLNSLFYVGIFLGIVNLAIWISKGFC